MANPATSAPPRTAMAEAKNQNSLFWRLWLRALTVRRPQAAVALVSLVVGAAVISTLVTLSSGVGRGMTEEFRTYGANVVIAPAADAAPGGGAALMSSNVLGRIDDLARREPGLISVPRLDIVARIENASARSTQAPPASADAVVVGADFAALLRLNPAWRATWQTQGSTGSLEGSTAAVGQRVAAALHVSVGDTVRIELGARPALALRIASVVATGASEDDEVFVPLAALQRLAGAEGKISLVELSVPGDPHEVDGAIRALQAGLARAGSGVTDVEVRPVRQIAQTEGQVLGTILGLVVWLTILILVIIALSVMANMTAIVLERRKDIAVMKALGAGDRLLMRLFLAEGAALGLGGGLVGVLAGTPAARLLGQRLFGVALDLTWWTLPLVCAASMALSTLATLVPVRIVRGIQPAAVLKGQ